MFYDKTRPMQRVIHGGSVQGAIGHNGNNLDRRPFVTGPPAWLVTGGTTTRAADIRARQQLPGATPSCLGVKCANQALVFDGWQIIRHAGITLDGSILEFDTGSRPIGAYCPNYVAVDNDLKNVQLLRCNGIKAILGTIEDLPFPANSFDYVLSFSPLIIRDANDWRWVNEDTNEFEVRSDYMKVIVGRAIEIARQKVLIASRPIALDPPFAENAELIVTDRRHQFYYVVYTVN